MPEMEAMPDLALSPEVATGIALLCLLAVALVVYVTVRAYRKRATTGAEGLVGQKGHVVEWAGKLGRVRAQGEIWQAFSETDLEMAPDAPVRIESVDVEELTVKIVPL